MKQQLFALCCMLLFQVTNAQSNQKPLVKQQVPELKKLLSGTGLPFRIINDSLALIPYQGENIESYQVLVQKSAGLYIVYTNLTEALPKKLNETQYKYLLQQNDHFDIVKIGLGEDGTMYLRADIYRTTTTTAILKRIITQVANVTNIIGGDLK
jgi:hypothetical protein